MFKIEIKADDGRVLKMSKNNFIYFRDTEGNDTFWEWEHIVGRVAEFEPLFSQARTLIDQAEKHLPDLPMPGLR